MLLLAAAVMIACNPAAQPAPVDGRLRVLATTSIVGDVVRQVGGDAVDVQVLLPIGADPHAFEPTPRDVARIAGARIIFANGAGLEGFLDTLLANAGGKVEIVHVSDGIALRQAEVGAAADAHEQAGGDPHVWTDPNNVAIWTQNIEQALIRLDGEQAGQYRANAEAYRGQLHELDAWIRAQIGQIPEANRRLVTDHEAFGYLAARYGLRQIGTVFPGLSTLAEPSAQELAALEDAIRAQKVKAVFVGVDVNANLARRVTADTGARLIYLYAGSLGKPGGEAGTYLDYMRHNVSALVQGLK